MSKIKIKPQPGVMVYDECFKAMSYMPDNDVAALLRAMFVYKNTGDEPEFIPYSPLATSWEFVRGRLENDRRKYIDKIVSGKYASYLRECKRDETPYLDFDEWKEYCGYNALT